MLRMVKPQPHLIDYYTFFDNTKLFYSLIKTWINKSYKEGVETVIDEKGKESTRIKKPLIIGDDTFYLRSKKGMTWRKLENGTFKRNFEYEIKMQSRDKMKSFYISFSPEISNYHYGPNKTYGDYQPYKLKKKCEGVDCHVIHVNIDYDVGQNILKLIMKSLELDNFWNNQREDMGKIKQYENYIRYNEKYERKIAMILEDMTKVIGFCGSGLTKFYRDMEDYNYDLIYLKSNRFGELGFYTDQDKWRFAIKTYRSREYRQFETEQPLRHPKLEIFLDDEKKGRTYPDLKDIKKLQQTINQIFANIIKWAKIDDKDSYIRDSYFDNNKFIEIEYIEAKQLYDQLKKFYVSLMPEVKTDCYKNLGIYDYFNCILVNGNVNYEQLCLSTGFSLDWIRKITYRLESMKIVRRIRSTLSLIQFHSNKIMEIVKGILNAFKFEMNMNEKSRKLRKNKRIKSRENRKDLKTKIKDKLTRKNKLKLEPTILEEQFVKKSGVRLWSKIGLVKKVNGGLYRLQNIDYLDKKPENYEKLLRDYG